MSFALGYRVEPHGWATIELQSGDQHLRVPASYITDALGDLVRAAAAIANGSSFAGLTLAHEPEYTRVRLDRQGDVVEVSAWRYPDEPDPLSEQEGSELFRAGVPAAILCAAISTAAHVVLDQFGVAGYGTEWEAPFPLADLTALDAVLSDS